MIKDIFQSSVRIGILPEKYNIKPRKINQYLLSLCNWNGIWYESVKERQILQRIAEGFVIESNFSVADINFDLGSKTLYYIPEIKQLGKLYFDIPLTTTYRALLVEAVENGRI